MYVENDDQRNKHNTNIWAQHEFRLAEDNFCRLARLAQLGDIDDDVDIDLVCYWCPKLPLHENLGNSTWSETPPKWFSLLFRELYVFLSCFRKGIFFVAVDDGHVTDWEVSVVDAQSICALAVAEFDGDSLEDLIVVPNTEKVATDSVLLWKSGAERGEIVMTYLLTVI